MSLMNDILPYIDGNGLVSPSIVPPGVLRNSDNGPLFTSQLLILADKNDEEADPKYLIALRSCVDSKGYLHRAPGDLTQDAPDDHYGVLSLDAFLFNEILDVRLPIKCWHPALLYLQGLSHIPMLPHLLSFIVALIIAFSNYNEDSSSTNNKILTWTLIKGTESRSWLCNLGGKFWTWRMKKIYGHTAQIALLYFGSEHPFVKHWSE